MLYRVYYDLSLPCCIVALRFGRELLPLHDSQVYLPIHALVLGQVILATFNSQQGLRRLGGNLFQSSYASGEPAIGEPGTGSRGDLQGFALENSNVELEHEFVKMIQSQRSYQANARVISTANDTLTELVNLV